MSQKVFITHRLLGGEEIIISLFFLGEFGDRGCLLWF